MSQAERLVENLVEYAEVIANWGTTADLVEPASLPVLDPDGGKAGRRRKAVGKLQCVSADEILKIALGCGLPVADRGRVCVVLRHDMGAIFGVAHAKSSGKRILVVDSVRDIFASPGIGVPWSEISSITLVASASSIAVEGLACLTRRGSAERRAVPFGILTASTASTLSALVARNARRRPCSTLRACVLWDGSEFAPLSASDRRVFESPLIPEVWDSTIGAGQFPLVVLRGHGRDYCALGGHLCSRSERSEGAVCVENLSCVSSEWPRFLASRIACDVLLLECCHTANFRQSLQPAVNLVTRVLDGGCYAVLSPYRLYGPFPEVPLVVWSRLCSGVRLGQLCCELNAMLAAARGDAANFFLFGDPELQLFAPVDKVLRHVVAEQHSDLFRVERDGEEREAQHNSQAICTVEGLLHSDREGAGEKFHCVGTSLEPAEGPVSASVVALGSGRSLVIVRRDGGQLPLRIDFSIAPASSPRLAHIAAAILANVSWALRAREPLDFPGRTELERLLQERWQSLVSDGAVAVPAVYAERRDLRMRIRSLCAQLNSSLVEHASHAMARRDCGWMARYFERYLCTVPSSEETTELACPMCASDLIYRAYFTGPGIGDLRRIYECEACGPISDVPASYGPVVFSNVDNTVGSCKTRIIVAGRNSQQSSAIAHASFHPGPLTSKADFVVEPRIQECEVGGGEHFEFSFELTVARSLNPHAHNFKAIVALNGALLFANRRFIVRCR